MHPVLLMFYCHSHPQLNKYKTEELFLDYFFSRGGVLEEIFHSDVPEQLKYQVTVLSPSVLRSFTPSVPVDSAPCGICSGV